MNFFDFLERKYVEVNTELQTEFSLFKQAKTHSIQNLIAFMRCIYRWVSYPIIVVEFILICLNLRSKPLSLKERSDAIRAKEVVVQEA